MILHKHLIHLSYIIYDIVYDITYNILTPYHINICVCYCQVLLLNLLLHQAMLVTVLLGAATTSAIFRTRSIHSLVPCCTTLGHWICSSAFCQIFQTGISLTSLLWTTHCKGCQFLFQTLLPREFLFRKPSG